MTKPILGELRHTYPTGHLRDNEIEVQSEIWEGYPQGWVSNGPVWVEMNAHWAGVVGQSMKPVVVASPEVGEAEREIAAEDLLGNQAVETPPSETSLPDYGTADAPLMSPALQAQVEAETGTRVEHDLNCGIRVEPAVPIYGMRPEPAIPDGYSDRRVNGDALPGTLVSSIDPTGAVDLGALIDAFQTRDLEPLGSGVASATEYCGATKATPELENSGFNVNYYSVEVRHPKRPGKAPYTFEVEDLIEAMDLNFHEGNVLKSLVRSVNERNFGASKKGSDYVRDAEKMVHSSSEELRRRKLRALEGKK
jgi:hypothetical protein